MRPWLELVRIPAIFTAPADVLFGVGLAAACGAIIEPGVFLTLLIISLCVYAGGMAANDIFDVRIDRQERPDRPIPSGRIRYGSAWTLVFVLHATAIGLAWSLGSETLIVVTVTIAATYGYNGVVKGSFLGPIGMGLCRYGNALIGLSILGPTLLDRPEIFLPSVGTLAYVTALTLVSTYEVDGASRRKHRNHAFLGVLVASGLAALPTIIVFDISTWVLPLISVPVIWILPSIRRAWDADDDTHTRLVVIRCIHGIAIINGVLATLIGQSLLGATIVALILPARFVGRRFYAT